MASGKRPRPGGLKPGQVRLVAPHTPTPAEARAREELLRESDKWLERERKRLQDGRRKAAAFVEQQRIDRVLHPGKYPKKKGTGKAPKNPPKR